ncbi:SNF2 family N-terminal domain-containing protein [Mycena floridula]|nr:SNF2 family N-terminal domain-containing protein [Mycena floridula]
MTSLVGYCKSNRAKCTGPYPCKGTPMNLGSLRYGELVPGEYGETVQWRHWGCVTPEILGRLAKITVERLSGFKDLQATDQTKIRRAITERKVDPSDIPPSAALPSLPSRENQASVVPKRKATDDPPHASTSAGSQPFASQAVDDDDVVVEEESKDELFCSLSTSAVGIQYYQGLVGSGEEVLLQREPHNRYDPNAIQVLNIGRVQVGHLPRNVAGKLARLLDARLVKIEGVIREGNVGRSGKMYKLDMTLKIYGAVEKRAQLEPLLIWATPGQRGFPSSSAASSGPSRAPVSGRGTPVPSSSQGGGQRRAASGQTPAQIAAVKKQQEALAKAAELKQMLSGLEKVDDEGRRSSLLDTLCSTDDVLNLPVHPNPPGLENEQLLVDLMKHQKQGLLWCINQENPKLPESESDKPVQFWQYKTDGSKPYYYNLATKTPQQAPPDLGRGGLFADAMGLGKTLTMLALILATKKETPQGFSNSTLIVVPLSVLSNWEQQVADHIPGTLSLYVYYGDKRNISGEDLMTYDIVLTTYQAVVGEHADAPKQPVKKMKKIDRSLFQVSWKRIILDEGHTIRNPKTKTAKSVTALNAWSRFVLTGTPIINSPRDLGSILTFLQVCRPLDSEEFFSRLLLRPLKNGIPSGAELLRAIMSQSCIRRTKEMQDGAGRPLVPLPPVDMTVVKVTLSTEARTLYDEVEELSNRRLEGFLNANVIVQSNVLSMLTRMRQLALHPALVPRSYLEDLRAGTEENNQPSMIVTAADKIKLQDKLLLAVEECEECPVCFDILKEPRITGCAHIFCLPCITEVISRDSKCPMDRRLLSLNDLYEPPPPTDLTQRPIRQEEENPDFSGSSAKIDQLIHLLRLTPGEEKSLVFSQFTSFLDKIGDTLEEQGIPYLRFDGQMSAKRRQETIAQFSVPVNDRETTPVIETSSRLRVKKSAKVDAMDSFINDEDEDSDFVMDGDVDPSSDIDFEESPVAKSKKGKAPAKPKSKARNYSPPADGDLNPKVMLISLKAGALGLNLTVANNVYLMDPWWQEGIESQAIDRVNRIGQKRPVHVYQLIAEDTVESKVLDIQDRKKTLIAEAFSGIKRTETPRQKREARLQELIELFGRRQQPETVE